MDVQTVEKRDGGRQATRENRHAEGLGTRTGSSRMDDLDSGKKEKRNKPTIVEWGLD